MADRFQIELAATLLEEILQTLTQQVHHHHVEHLAIVSLLVANEVQEGHEGLSAHLMDEFGLPEQHDVALHLDCFFLWSSA